MIRYALYATTMLAVCGVAVASPAQEAGSLRPGPGVVSMDPLPNPLPVPPVPPMRTAQNERKAEPAKMPLRANVVAPPAKAANPLDILQAISQWSVDDANTTIAIANVPNPPDAEAIACANFVIQNQNVLTGGGQAFIQPKGVMSTVETAHIGIGRLTGGLLSAALKVPFEQQCGPWLMSLQGDVVALGAAGLLGGVLHLPVPMP